jgi:hypothetical protein
MPVSEHAQETQTESPPAVTTPPETTTAATTAAPAPAAFTPEQQAEINRQIGKARDEGRKAAADEAKRKHAEDEAKAKGEWEKVAAERERENAELKAQLAARDRALLVAKVAAKHQLPPAIADRLAGDDEAALEADAKELAKLLGPRPAPDTEAGAGTQTPTNRDRPTPKKVDGPVYAFDGTRKVPWPSRPNTRP